MEASYTRGSSAQRLQRPNRVPAVASQPNPARWGPLEPASLAAAAAAAAAVACCGGLGSSSRKASDVR